VRRRVSSVKNPPEITDAHPAYRREGSHTLLEVTLDEVRQLFHSLDPAPFRQKDLDSAAEEYIVEAVREIGQRGPLKLVFYLPTDAVSSEDARTLPAAVRNYFTYRSRQRGLTLRQTLRRGLGSLLVGVLFLALCLSLRQLVATSGWGTGTAILGEGLLIVGWIALWRPVEIFLYEWWPILEDQRRFAWIARQAIEVRPRAG
jgi:hypothetical protein